MNAQLPGSTRFGTEPSRRAGRASACGRPIGRKGWLAALVAWGLLAGVPAVAQYTAVAGSADTGIPAEESLRRNVEEARWTFGPLRVQPWLGLSDLSYVSQQQNASAEEDGESPGGQYTLTAGAGLRAYVPVGSKLVWAGHVLPEYVWWQDDESKDGLAGRYGIGLFGYTNRVEFRLFHRREKSQRFFSDEVQELTTTATTTTGGEAGVRVARGLHAYAGWQEEEFSGNGDDDQIFTLLDRTEDSVFAGLRLRSHRDWSVGVGVRSAEGTFDPAARRLSFESEALTFDAQATLRKFTLNLRLEDTEFTPAADSQLRPFEARLGSLGLGYRPVRRLGLEVFSERRYHFSVEEERSVILTDEDGLRVSIQRRILGLTLLAATGTLGLEGGGSAVQATDFDTLGADLTISLERWGSLRLSLIRRDFADGEVGMGRDVTSFGASFQFGERVRRLGLAEATSEW